MLVLSRKSEEDVRFPNLGITVSVVSIHGQRVRLGIEAPREIEILRGELDKSGVGRDSKPGRDAMSANSSQPAALAQHKAVSSSRQEADASSQREADVLAQQEAARRERHDYTNQVNAAMLGLHLARRQIAAGRFADADEALNASLRRLTDLERLAERAGRGETKSDAACESRSGKGPQAAGGSGAPSDSGSTQESTGVAQSDVADHGASGKPSVDVLLVEDDVNERTLLRGLLELEGYHVRTAGNGSEALRCLESFTPRFVLLDMCMPGAGGDVAVDGIRRQARLRHLPVFAVSASSPETVGLSISPESVNGWFPKPLDAAQMLDELRFISASLSA